jgi:hypothetical protein
MTIDSAMPHPYNPVMNTSNPATWNRAPRSFIPPSILLTLLATDLIGSARSRVLDTHRDWLRLTWSEMDWPHRHFTAN